jgi:hypothetical protein
MPEKMWLLLGLHVAAKTLTFWIEILMILKEGVDKMSIGP